MAEDTKDPRALADRIKASVSHLNQLITLAVEMDIDVEIESHQAKRIGRRVEGPIVTVTVRQEL